MPAINKTLRGRYRIIHQLGDSEAGTIYKAHDSVRETNVALKEILIDLEKSPTITERELLKRSFADEAKNLAKVKHESLPQVRGFFSEADRQYLVMELVDGEDTSELLAKGKKPLPLSDVTNWADQLLDALDYLHTLAPPVIHGNIKPENIKLTSRGRIKLLDFGIAKSADAKKNTHNPEQISVTAMPYSPLEQLLRTNDLNGQSKITEGYAEKVEAILKQPVDARSDIYSLGATLYNLATAQIPVDALERALNVWAGETDSLPPACEVNPAVPVEISNVLMKALKIEREKRYGSAAEMRQALQIAAQKAKQRETEDAKNQETAAAREALLAEEKKLQEERQRVANERLRLEAEQKKKNEAITRQLKEAETQRLEAEKRATEAEKRLLEKETKTPVAAKPVNADAPASSNKKSGSPAEFNTLFSEPKKDNQMMRMLPVGLIVLMLGGAVWGIWAWQKSNPAEANQTSSKQENLPANKAASETKIEPDTAPGVIKTSETIQPPPAPVTSSFTDSTSRPEPKNKPAQPVAPRVEKQTPPPVKAQPKPTKKAVTVDDIIGSN